MLTIALWLASGIPFYAGVLLCVTAPLTDFSRLKLAAWTGRFSVVIGAILIAASATPMSAVLAWLAGIAAVGWFTIPQHARLPRARSVRVWAGGGMALGAALSGAFELPYAITPRASIEGGSLTRIAVIGDSLSAGIGDGVSTWPALLEQRTGASVSNLAAAGATAASALRQAERLPPDTQLVLLLIGGNDLLGGRSAADFARDLDVLLERSGRNGARLMMFELPAPPFRAAYVAAQRRLAARHGALLIPRRRLAFVLAATGATSDGLHLSARGHAAFAVLAGELLHLPILPRTTRASTAIADNAHRPRDP